MSMFYSRTQALQDEILAAKNAPGRFQSREIYQANQMLIAELEARIEDERYHWYIHCRISPWLETEPDGSPVTCHCHKCKPVPYANS